MKKRHWFKRSSVILSAVVSIAAPVGKTSLQVEAKGSKSCKKSKAPLSSMADDGESADASPPFSEGPPDALVSPDGAAISSDLASVDSCCSTSVAPQAAGDGKFLRPRPPMEKPRTPRYAWKRDIHTTVFWIGELPTEANPTPNHASSWDAKWAQSYGGYDNPDPDARNGFLPTAFTPKQNPFYVALPYNDVSMDGHKDEASKIIPWFKKELDGSTSRYKSTCKGRWIAIRKGDRICYAQWEDAGPFNTTDGDYVFGDARPKAEASDGAGLDVSPAVRDFLGLDGHDRTDWKFVEFEDVPLGPWAEHGENNDFVLNRKTAGKDAVAQTRGREPAGARRARGSTGRTRVTES